MREILFRGKRADNGKWVEGCFCDKTCKTMFSKAEPSAQIIDNNLFWYDVDPRNRRAVHRKDRYKRQKDF